MAIYGIGQRVRIIDQNSQYRNFRGVVTRVVNSNSYRVRLEGHPFRGSLTFLSAQLTVDVVAVGRTITDDKDAAAQRSALRLGTAATRDVPESGNASATQVVLGNDTRLGGGTGGENITEVIDDRVSQLLQAGDNITLTYDDSANTLTIAADIDATTINNFAEAVDDRVSTLLQAGDNITLTYNDAANTLTIAASIDASDVNNFSEAVDDRVSTLLQAGNNITLTYNDAANTLTIASTASGGGVDNYYIRKAPNSDTYFYLLVMGQSNAIGAAGSAEGDKTIAAGIQIWNNSAWTSPSYGTSPLTSSVNVGIWVANYLRRSSLIPSGTTIRILPNWLGGEPIEGWTGNGTLSPRWVELTNAIAAASIPRIDHCIFWQGEANSVTSVGTAKTLTAYAAQFSILLSQLRALPQWLSTTGLTVSMLGMWPNTGNNDRNDFFLQLQSVLDDPYVDVISSVGCTPTSFNNDGNGNNSHFDGNSIQKMAQRHFDSMSLMMQGLGAKRNTIVTASGSPWRVRQRKDVTGAYTVSQDDLAGEVILTVTGNVTITLPALNRSEWAGSIIIDNRASQLYAVTLTSPTTIDIGNGTNGTTVDLYTGYRNTYTVTAFSQFWRVTQTTISVGSVRKMFFTPAIPSTITEGRFSNVIFNLTASGVLTLPVPTFSMIGALARFVNGMSTFVTGAPAVNLTSTAQINSVRSKVINRGTGYVPGEVLTITGGTGTPGTLTVGTTTVVSAAIVAGGTGGSNGTQIVTGTTGTGTYFQASVTVSGGAITAILAITVPGSYTANPVNLSSEPVTGAGLSNARLSLVMGISTLTTSATGAYTVLPPQPGTQSGTTGSGTGATFALGFNNAIRGLNPRIYQMSRTIGKPGDQVVIEQSLNSLDVMHDTAREGSTFRLTSGTLSTQTLTYDLMLQQRAYRVAAGASITLPLAALCEEGATLFWATDDWTLLCQSGDFIIGGSTAVTSFTVRANTAVVLHAMEAGNWLVLPAGPIVDFRLTSNVANLPGSIPELFVDDLFLMTRESFGTLGARKVTGENIGQFAGRNRANFLRNGNFSAQNGVPTTTVTANQVTPSQVASGWYSHRPTANVTFTQETSQSLTGARPVLSSHCLRIEVAAGNAQFAVYNVLSLEDSVALRNARINGQLVFRWQSQTPSSETLRPHITILGYTGTANGAARLSPFSGNNPWTYNSDFLELTTAQLPDPTPGSGNWTQIAVQAPDSVPDNVTHLLLVFHLKSAGYLLGSSYQLRISKAGLYPATQAQHWLPEPRDLAGAVVGTIDHQVPMFLDGQVSPQIIDQKNYVVNPQFRIQQQPGPISTATNGTFVFDEWSLIAESGPNWNATVVQSTPSGVHMSGAATAGRVIWASGNAAGEDPETPRMRMGLVQVIPHDVTRAFWNRPATASVSVRLGVGAADPEQVTFTLLGWNGTANASGSRSVTSSLTTWTWANTNHVVLATSTVAVPAATEVQIPLTVPAVPATINNIILVVSVQNTSTSWYSYGLCVSEVMLNNSATRQRWQMPDPGEELYACLRRFFRLRNSGTSVLNLAQKLNNRGGSGDALLAVSLPVPMATAPLVTVSSNSGIRIRGDGYAAATSVAFQAARLNSMNSGGGLYFTCVGDAFWWDFIDDAQFIDFNSRI